MSAPINLSDLLHGKSVEWERLEFKAGWNPKSLLHTLCAFANDFHNLGGGYILIGVDECDGRPVLPPLGLDPTILDGIQKEILHLGYNAIQPAYHPLIFPEVVDGRHVLLIHAPGGQNRPFKAKRDLSSNCREWLYFIRKNSSTVRARDNDERELLSLAANIPFDDRINQRASFNDLSRPLIVGFLKQIGSDLAKEAQELPLSELAHQLQLVDGPSEAVFPRNVGLLFFNETPWKFFPSTQIDVVWFPDEPSGDTFTEKIFKGPLPVMMRESLDYILRTFISETVIKTPGFAESKRVQNFPFSAIEELLANALYHRCYEIREPIEIRITEYEMTFLSFPGPDRSIRLDHFREGRAVSRRYRNRRIGGFLKELNFTEGRATGIPKVIRAMRENGSPAPIFEFDEDHTYFLVRLPVHPLSKHSALRSSGDLTTEITPRVEQLLRALKTEKSRSELMSELGFKDDEAFRDLYLTPTLQLRFIEIFIPGTAKNQIRKYRVTSIGSDWLAERSKSSH